METDSVTAPGIHDAILIVGPDFDLLTRMSDLLADQERLVLTAQDTGGGRQLLERRPCMLVIVDVELLGTAGLEFIQEVRELSPLADVVALAGQGKLASAVHALKLGAADYLTKPVLDEEFQIVIRRRLDLRRLIDENRSLKETVELLSLCREIASHIEFEPLGATALRILMSIAAAKSGVVLFREDHDRVFRIFAVNGMTKKEGKIVADHVAEKDAAFQKSLPIVSWMDVAELRLPNADGPVLLIPLRLEGKEWTLVALGFDPESALPREKKEQIRVLSRQIALSLNNALRYERLRDLAFVDDLTGLYNMRYLDRFADTEMKRASRHGYPVSFLFVDLDFFKQVNDRFGHLVGSRLLISVGQELRNAVRDIDAIVRYGGDEFILILINTPTQGAKQVAERIRRCVQDRPFLAELGIERARDVRLSASIGVATFPDHARDKETIIRLADEAMYHAKTASRNAIYVASPAGVPAREMQSLLIP
ncbi:MAG TPA: diguanylate cyclase [Bdellovibrionota bacterium]|nr:diguanylate cyclase [Bdellovibrionota bacterium]